MNKAARLLLGTLGDAQDRGSHAVACDGTDRAPAHELDKLGYAQWCGTSWGSSFWCITDKGREFLKQDNYEPPEPPGFEGGFAENH